MAIPYPDVSTPLGERAAYRLSQERFIWLTTVDAKGRPQPTLVWFLWEEITTTILIYHRRSKANLERLYNLVGCLRRPRRHSDLNTHMSAWPPRTYSVGGASSWTRPSKAHEGYTFIPVEEKMVDLRQIAATAVSEQ
jgi:hypothetical protein